MQTDIGHIMFTCRSSVYR